MKHAIYIYFLLSGIIHAGSIRQLSRINDDHYPANVTTEFLSLHSVSPKPQSLVEDIKTFTRIAHNYIETHLDTKIVAESVAMSHLEFCSLSEGDTSYYYAVYSIVMKRADGKHNYYRIPIALDYTVIPPKLFK